MELPLPVVIPLLFGALAVGFIGARMSRSAPDAQPQGGDSPPTPSPAPTEAAAAEAKPSSEATASKKPSAPKQAPAEAAPKKPETPDVFEGQKILEKAMFTDGTEAGGEFGVASPDVRPGQQRSGASTMTANDLPNVEFEPMDTDAESLPVVTPEPEPEDPNAPVTLGEIGVDGSDTPPRKAEGDEYPTFHDDESTLINFDNFDNLEEMTDLADAFQAMMKEKEAAKKAQEADNKPDDSD